MWDAINDNGKNKMRKILDVQDAAKAAYKEIYTLKVLILEKKNELKINDLISPP